jgi:DNA-binding NarL/FixJ family response regulator
LDIEAAAPAELQTIAECAHALGGRVYTEHHTERGTTLILELPRVQAVRRDLEDERWRAAVPEERAPTRSLRLYVLDQQGVRRAGFTHFLDAQQELRVVGHAATIAQARRSVGWLQPDVVFVDAEETTATVTVREVRQASANSIVIGLASRTARVSAEELTAAGAAGLLPHDLERDELRDAIIRLVRGDDLEIKTLQVDPSVPVGSALNSREWAVLKLIVGGRTNAEIGAELFLAPKTIERHVATITHKIGARNRAHLVAVAIGRGLVRPPAE